MGYPDKYNAELRRPWLQVKTLAPEIQLINEGAVIHRLRGNGARLLAWLVAYDGAVEVDRTIDQFWPNASIDSARQRLHTQLYRLRQLIGDSRSEIIRIEAGLVILDLPDDAVDVWQLRTLARRSRVLDPDVTVTTLRLYEEDFCARQLAYEDFAIEIRRELRNIYACAVCNLLERSLDQGSAYDIQDIARRAWQILPDDERVCSLAARVVALVGARREAWEMVTVTAQRLQHLGIPTDGLEATLTESQLIVCA